VAVRRRGTTQPPGQHFLRSRALAAEIVRGAGVAPGDRVLDIGAGTGMLTSALVDAGARVLAVEVDDGLASELARRFSRTERVTVVQADARRVEWPRTEFAVVSNLPFAGSGGILARLLGDPRLPLRQADLVLQWEAAAKHAALWPTTLRSAFWGAWYDLSITMRLSRAAFAPQPAVDAGVLRAVRRSSSLVDASQHERYQRFLASTFASRAPLVQALSPFLSGVQVRRLAAAYGFSPRALPRDLGARQWAGVFAFVQSGRGRS
jgi:23S rRNA (adenine-N6)-dimethyltransferase